MIMKSLLANHTKDSLHESPSKMLNFWTVVAVGKFMKTLNRFRKSQKDGAGESSSPSRQLQKRNSLIAGTQLDATADMPAADRRVIATVRGHMGKYFSDWGFNVLDVEIPVLKVLTEQAFERLELVLCFKIPIEVLSNFISAVEKGYHGSNPYHNFYHAASVFQHVMIVHNTTQLSEVITVKERFALFVATLCHDIGHTGRTNEFESQVKGFTINHTHIDGIYRRSSCCPGGVFRIVLGGRAVGALGCGWVNGAHAWYHEDCVNMLWVVVGVRGA